jgi:hypothetical protein
MIPDLFDIVKGLEEGRYSQEQALNWINIHIQDAWNKEHDQERRRRLFEEVALAFLHNPAYNHIDEWNWSNVSGHVEILISKADAFATKTKED